MKRLSITFIVFIMIGCQNNVQQIKYPDTRESDHTDVYHGVAVTDPYRWLEDDMSNETADWVKSQNKSTFRYLKKIPFRRKLEKRIKSLNNYEKVSAPFKEGDYEYFYKNTGLQNHSIVYRQPIGTNKDPEVFLDPNKFSKDGTVALRGLSFSEDASLATYMITEGGSDWRKILVIDVETKKIIEDTLKNVKFSGVSWLKNKGFYYSSYDNPKEKSALSAKTQLHKLYYHKLGTPQSSDQLVYGGEQQPNRYIRGYVTEDQNYLIISASQNTSGNQIFVMDLNNPNQLIVQLEDDYFSRCSVVDNDGNKFFLYTNIGTPNYKFCLLYTSPSPRDRG